MDTPQEPSNRAVVPEETFEVDGDDVSDVFEQMTLAGINRLHADMELVSTTYGDECDTDVTLTRVQVDYCEGHADTFCDDPGGHTVASMSQTALAEVKDLLEAVLHCGLYGLDGVCKVTVDPWARTIDGSGEVAVYRLEPIRFTLACSTDEHDEQD